RCSKKQPLFDRLVGSKQKVRRNRQAERLGGFEVDHELELGRLHDRQVGGLLAFENPAGTSSAPGEPPPPPARAECADVLSAAARLRAVAASGPPCFTWPAAARRPAATAQRSCRSD